MTYIQCTTLKSCSVLTGTDSRLQLPDWKQAAAQNQNPPGPHPWIQTAGKNHFPPSKLKNTKLTLQPLLLLPPPLQHLHSPLLGDLTSVGLRVAQWVEDFRGRRGGGLGLLWQNGPLHRFITETLPHFLGLLQHASLLGQQELRSESRRDGARNSTLFCFIYSLQRRRSGRHFHLISL